MNIKRAFLAAVAVLMMPGLVMAQASNNTFSTIISDPMAGSPDMTITCDGGIPLTQTGAVGTTFTVTQLNTGTVCNVDLAGDLNSGYELDYFKCENGAGDTPAPVTDTGCEFTVETGTDAWSAQVWVTSAPVKYSVAVGWVIDPDLADGGIGGDAEVQMSCYGATETVTTFRGDPTAPMPVSIPVLPGSLCSATLINAGSAVEVDESADCAPTQIDVGDADVLCEITATAFYEGIPTLSQYGMAIMALLMLAVGFVGFRRFV